MAISNLVSGNNFVDFERPRMERQAAANDNLVRVNGGIMQFGSELVSFLNDTKTYFSDLVDVSSKTISSFKSAISSLINLEKNTRFKFTYLRKEIEASRNDFLAALKALSFSTSGDGETVVVVSPEDEKKDSKSLPPIPPPIIPPIIPRTKPDTKPGPGTKPDPNKTKPDPNKTKPDPNKTKKLSINERINRMLGRTAKPADVNITKADLEAAVKKPKTGSPTKVKVGLPPEIDSAKIESSVKKALNQKVTIKIPTAAPAKLSSDLTPGPKNLGLAPPGEPEKVSIKSGSKFSRYLGGFGTRALGPLLAFISAAAASKAASEAYDAYETTGDINYLKQAYEIVGAEVGSQGAGWPAGIAASFTPLGPVGGLLIGGLASAAGSKQGTIYGRALFETHTKGTPLANNIAIETANYMLEDKKAIKAASEKTANQLSSGILGKDFRTKAYRQRMKSLEGNIKYWEKELEKARDKLKGLAIPDTADDPDEGYEEPGKGIRKIRDVDNSYNPLSLISNWWSGKGKGEQKKQPNSVPGSGGPDADISYGSNTGAAINNLSKETSQTFPTMMPPIVQDIPGIDSDIGGSGDGERENYPQACDAPNSAGADVKAFIASMLNIKDQSHSAVT